MNTLFIIPVQLSQDVCTAIAVLLGNFKNLNDHFTTKKPKIGKTKMLTFLPWYSRFQDSLSTLNMT